MNPMMKIRKRTTLPLLAAGAIALIALAALALSIRAGGHEPEPDSGAAAQSEEGHAGMETAEMPADGSVRISPTELRTFGVTFGTAEVRPLERTIRGFGTVDFDETRMARVSPKFGGWVEELHADFTGRSVRKGEPLFEVYSPELVTAQEELLLAARMRDSVGTSRIEGVGEGADELLESARRRLLHWDVSGDQIDRILEERRVRRTLTIHAPVTGIVMEKDLVEGQHFGPGTNLYMIADLSRVWVNAEIYERDLALVSEGMPATVAVQALPGERFDARMEFVHPTLDERRRSMRVRTSIANPGGVLKPGMYATVRARAAMDEVLTVPTSSVLHSGERAVAFVSEGEDRHRLVPRELTLGLRGDDRVEVRDGLEAGDRVVTSAQFLLDSESNLAEVMQAMMAEMGMSDMEGMDMDDMDMDEMEGMEEMDDMDGMDGMKETEPSAPDTTPEG